MEEFTEEHSTCLLNKEWLVKVDGQASKPYLLKFYTSIADLWCCILVTDTKTTWTEVLSTHQFARRWRLCNRLNPADVPEDQEDEWRSRHLQLLSQMHTLGGIADLSFEVTESHYSDVAFEFECETFRWRWEANVSPPKLAADLISRHLIMPLISLTHLAFNSAESVSELSEADLQNAVDKAGRTARRSVDTHVKHAMSKPRVATTLRRMSALLGFISDLAAIETEVTKPSFQLPSLPSLPVNPRTKTPLVEPEMLQADLPVPLMDLDVLERSTPQDTRRHIPPVVTGTGGGVPPAPDGSETESSSDDAAVVPPQDMKAGPSLSSNIRKDTPPKRSASPAHLAATPDGKDGGPSPDESPEPAAHRPPAKKIKAVVVDSSDSDGDRQRATKSGRSEPKRGTRQPVRRGIKRF